LVIDRQEPHAFRLENPSLPVGSGRRGKRHGDPSSVSRELVRNCLPDRLRPSVELHLDCGQVCSCRPDQVRTAPENRNFDLHLEPRPLQPRHEMIAKV